MSVVDAVDSVELDLRKGLDSPGVASCGVETHSVWFNKHVAPCTPDK